METQPSGVPGLDLVLGGGLQLGSLVVVAGTPGTGKTILAQQICFSQSTPEHPALYYTTLSEPHTKLVRHLEPFSFFDPAALEDRVEFLHIGDLLGGGAEPGLEPAVEEITRRMFEAGPSVVVIDSSKALHDFAPIQSFRSLVYQLASRVAHTGAVLVLVGEYTPAEMDIFPEFAVADTIIHVAREPRGPVDRLWLRVLKARGAAPLRGQHSLAIDGGGVTVFPRLESTLPARGLLGRERISIGVPGIDRMMGGGMRSGDATLALGPSGVGKTILALRFVAQGLEKGEAGLYLSFQETREQLVAKAGSFGWDLSGALASGQLRIINVPPVEVDLDAVGSMLRDAVDQMGLARIAVDSLAELAYAARQTERLPAYVWSVASVASAHGASTLVTSETATLGPARELAGGLSFLFHNLLLMRFFESESRIGRALTVLKMRDSDHDKSHVEYAITKGGIEVREVLTGLTGVLGFTELTVAPAGDVHT